MSLSQNQDGLILRVSASLRGTDGVFAPSRKGVCLLNYLKINIVGAYRHYREV